jgi:hypothetical protein
MPAQSISVARAALSVPISVLLLVLVACAPTTGGSAPASAGGPPQIAGPESNPPGDIPDSQVFVPFTAPDGVVRLSVPEGWAQRSEGGATVFADKLLAVGVETRPAATAPTVASATASDLAQLRATVTGFQPGEVTATQRPAGPVVMITYGARSTPDAVTGKTVAQAVERYLYWHAGHEVVLTLSAPAGTDTLDAWRTITDSVTWP